MYALEHASFFSRIIKRGPENSGMANGGLTTLAWVLLVFLVAGVAAFFAFRRRTSLDTESFQADDKDDKEKAPSNSKHREKPDDKEEDGRTQDEKDKKDYAHRIYVMKLYETLMKRAATDAEIDKYATHPSEPDILAAVIADNAELLPERQRMNASNVSQNASGAADQAAATNRPAPDAQDVPSKSKQPPSNLPKPAPSNSADDLEFEAYEGKCIDALPARPPAPPSRVCLDKADTLRRLRTISSEARQMYHLVSMY